jgi:uncharacterized protein (TIGR02266 family)
VSDPVTTARTARESLAKGLQALQSDPSVPAALVELAAPIAQAMGALHQIEKSNGTQMQPHADLALNNTRSALAALQGNPQGHPAVAAALEAVAASLGQVHQLTKMAQGPAAAAAQGNPPPAQRQPSQPAFVPPQQPQHMQPQMQQPPAQRQQAPSQPAFVPPQQQFAPQQQQQQPPQQARPVGTQPVPQAYAPPQQQAAAFAPTQVAQAVADPFAAPRAPAAAPAQGPSPAHNAAPGGGQMFNADLGAHSVTNFFKGLSGNDIIDHGGLFVSTYMVPKIGTPVRLKVSLPGGYEFEANAVVKWAREAADGSDAPPGFGAQFTQITPEARQLVYRYVRNREPLFHDDL